jgi:two-component system nitrate/nitrite response regulator NarL
MKPKYKLLVVDDHPLFRQGVRQLIELDSELSLIAEAATPNEAMRCIESGKPDLVLLDLNLGSGTNGLDFLKILRDTWPDLPIVILTVSDSEDDLLQALRDGAAGYLLKNIPPEDVLTGIHSALDGRLEISAPLREALSEGLTHAYDLQTQPATAPLLSLREKQIALRVARGESNKKIALHLGISDQTVKVHMKRILKRLEMKNRVELAVWVHKNLPLKSEGG